jgi:hypothetical protein
VQQEAGEWPATAANHRQPLALARAAGDRLAEAVSLTDLGLVQQMTGDYPAAAAGTTRAGPQECPQDARTGTARSPLSRGAAARWWP